MQPLQKMVQPHSHPHLSDARHPEVAIGPVVAIYVWPYSIRLIHWGLVLSIGLLSFTGYYIHNPFINGQLRYPFLMGWFRFIHEACGMVFMSLTIFRAYLFLWGNRWLNWRAFIPLRREQWLEMWKVAMFYAFISRRPVSKIGHNSLAAFSYVGLYALAFLEIVTGLVLYNTLRHSAFLGFFVGWVPRVVNIQNLRLIHFFLMFVFISFGIFHVHLSMLISRVEKHGLMDSIFIGYKEMPESEVDEEEERAAGGN